MSGWNGAATASDTERASPKSRSCSRSARRSPLARLTAPVDGCMVPMISRNRLVFPEPLRPMTPHRSPASTVKVTSESSCSAPNVIPTWAIDSWVIPCANDRSRAAYPRRPLGFGEPDGESVLESNQRRSQQKWFVDQQCQQPFIGQPCRAESESRVTRRLDIDQRRHAESLHESRKLTPRCRPLREVHEMRPHTALRKEPLRLSCVRALACTEDLDFHAWPSGSENMCVHEIYMVETSRSAACALSSGIAPRGGSRVPTSARCGARWSGCDNTLTRDASDGRRRTATS